MLVTGVFEVKSTGGDTRLGGEDFDTAVVAWAVKECEKKYKVNPSSSARAMRRLQTACERAKRALSSGVSTVIEVDSLYEGVDFNVTLSRCVLYYLSRLRIHLLSMMGA